MTFIRESSCYICSCLPSNKIDPMFRLLLGWKQPAVADEVRGFGKNGASATTQHVKKPALRLPWEGLTDSPKLMKKFFFRYLISKGWRQQASWRGGYTMKGVIWLGSPLFRGHWKTGNGGGRLKRISMSRNETLRRSYIDDICRFSAKDWVFLGESIFNEKTGWRQHG